MHFQIIIDVANHDLFVSLLTSGRKTLVFSHVRNLLKRSEALPEVFQNLLRETNLTINQCDALYVTSGPGSFTGARAGLVFSKTIAQVTGAKLFVASTFALAKAPLISCCLDGGGNNKYQAFWQSNNQIDMKLSTDSACPLCLIDYADIVANPAEYLTRFAPVAKPETATAIYLKNPTMGGGE